MKTVSKIFIENLLEVPIGSFISTNRQRIGRQVTAGKENLKKMASSRQAQAIKIQWDKAKVVAQDAAKRSQEKISRLGDKFKSLTKNEKTV